MAEKNLENIYVHEERTAGFKEAVKKIHGLEYVIIGNWDYQKQAKKELEKSEKKTAFLCTGDMFALNLIRMFEKMENVLVRIMESWDMIILIFWNM